MCLAKDKDQARIVFRYVKAILNHIPGSDKHDRRSDGADEIELTTGVTIMVKPADSAVSGGRQSHVSWLTKSPFGQAKAQTQTINLREFNPKPIVVCCIQIDRALAIF